MGAVPGVASVRSLVRRKMVLPAIKVLDLEAGRVSAVVSTEAEDRDKDILRVAGWKLENFLKHPVLLSSHDYRSLLSVIGEWESMEIKDRPKRLQGVARYYIGDGNAEADWAFKLAQRGRAAFSVGFIPNMDTAKERDGGDSWFGNWEFNDQELLEVSQVTIPSNPEGLQQLKSLMEHSGHIDPFLLSFVNDTLKELQPPAPVIDYRELVHSAFTKAYREVTPWYS